MPQTVLLVLALIIAAGVIAIIVLLLRPRARPIRWPSSGSPSCNARLEAMGELLQAHTSCSRPCISGSTR